MPDLLLRPWPWFVAGPLIGAIVPLLLWLGGRQFGISVNLRHLCAIPFGRRFAFFDYDWRREGAWNLVFVAGVAAGGFLGVHLLSANTDVTVFAPAEAVSWPALLTWRGCAVMVGGGFLVGFGARWAGGCTSGHAISGLASFDSASLVAVAGFFAGGLLMTHVVLPWLL